MSIKESRKRARGELPKREYREPYVVSESAIRGFVGSLGIHDVETAAARLQLVADATRHALDSRIDRLDRPTLALINEVANESTNKHYQRIMREIIAGVGQGADGIIAAHRTASLAVELAFNSTPDYFSALKGYRNRLRKIRWASGANQPSRRRAGSFGGF